MCTQYKASHRILSHRLQKSQPAKCSLSYYVKTSLLYKAKLWGRPRSDSIQFSNSAESASPAAGTKSAPPYSDLRAPPPLSTSIQVKVKVVTVDAFVTFDLFQFDETLCFIPTHVYRCSLAGEPRFFSTPRHAWAFRTSELLRRQTASRASQID